MKKLKGFIAILLSFTVLALVGCSSKKDTGHESTEKKNQVEEKDNNSTEIEEDQSQVVVATSVAVVEILDRLGVKLVGVPTTSYELPSSTKDAQHIGNPMNPDIEIIKSLKPTILVATDTLGSDYESLFESNNIPSLFVDLDSVDGLKKTVQQLGEKFNKVEKGKEILNELEEKERLFSSVPVDNEKNIMIVFAAPGGVNMMATRDSYIGNLVDIVGGKNLIEETGSPFVSCNGEALSQMNPDMILVMTHALPEQTRAEFEEVLETDVAWQNIPAVKEGRIEFLESNYFGMSANLKAVKSLEILRDIIYPKQ